MRPFSPPLLLSLSLSFFSPSPTSFRAMSLSQQGSAASSIGLVQRQSSTHSIQSTQQPQLQPQHSSNLMIMGQPSGRANNLSSKSQPLSHAAPGQSAIKGYGFGMGVVLGPGDLPVQPLSRERARGKFTVGRGPGGSTLPSHAQGVGLMDYNASILIDPHAVFPFDQGTDTNTMDEL